MSRSRRIPVGILACIAASAAAPSTAPAAVTATLSSGNLTLQGDSAPDTITVAVTTPSSGPTSYAVSTPGINDPDGASAQCSVAGDTLTCTGSFTIRVKGGAGADALSGSSSNASCCSGGSSYTLDGEADDDTLTSSSSDVSLQGGTGNDVLSMTGSATFGFSDSGGDGNDTFNGGEGYDSFTAEPGADTYNGGSLPASGRSYERYLRDGNEAASWQRSRAADSISYSGPVPAAVTLDGIANDGRSENDNVGDTIESVSGSDAADTLVAGANQVSFYGGRGTDTLTGSASNDDLDGGDGADNITGGAGDDSLNDGDVRPSVVPTNPMNNVVAGNDRLDGGPGNDSLFADLGADDLIGGPGTDYVDYQRDESAPAIPETASCYSCQEFRTPIAVTVTLDDAANDGAPGEGDNVHADIENVGGSAGDDTLVGSASANTLSGGAGNDTITGGGGLDLLYGSSGNDTFMAQDGAADNVDGGLGTDSAKVDLAGPQPGSADTVVDVETISGAPTLYVKPTLTLTTKSVKVKQFLKTGALPLTVTTTAPASVVGTITVPGQLRAVGGLVIGTGRLSLGTGTRKLNVTIAKKYRSTFAKRLRTKKQRRTGVKIKVEVTTTDAGGLSAVTAATITVRG